MSAALDWRTPSIRVHDSRDLPVRQIAYLRTHAAVPATALITRQHHNAAGHLVKQWDPRLATPNLTTVYGLGGEALMSDSVDAGWRLNLPGLAGQPLERWDERGSHWRTTFDTLLRVVAIEEKAVNVETFTYADANADAGQNLRGKLCKQKDAVGELQMESFALTGQPLKETRTFNVGPTLTSQRVFSPLGAALEQTDAGGHRQTSHYGLAGHLKQLKLLIKGAPESIDVLLDTQYNAAEQITEQLDGNGVCSRWTYDPADGRLHTQSIHKDTGEVLQNFKYFYDPVGNITRIEDHAFEAVYFANQRVDGHRDFAYDSLYRLTSASGYNDATPPGIPGLPMPSDKKNRLNYTETYDYDLGDNLIRTVHVRAGANRTLEMAIDPNSNRGVRCKPGDPPPEFDKLFDLHGNLKALQAGQDLQWNARDELMRVTLIARGGGRDDAEHYLYSQGARVFKRHETFTATAEHFHQVRYLPGLEIRSKDTGEELHVISVGNARCLHWVTGQPAEIPNNQLRYSLEDHLGSCTMELDQNARVISQEGYYPFGATAWMAADSETEVSYKFIRYSGKEMDVSGLYYYGARYYAPWLQRWISPDPAGDVDGLNLYGFVGNNPLRYFDNGGTTKTPSEHKAIIAEELAFLDPIADTIRSVGKTLGDLTSPASFRVKILKNFIYLSGRAAVGFFSGYTTTGMLPSSIPGELQGLSVGNETADNVNSVYAQLASSLDVPILPRASDLNVQSLRDQSSGKSASPLNNYTVAPKTWQERSENIRTLFSFGRDTVGGALFPGVSELAELFKISKDATKAEQLLTKFEMDMYDSMLDSLSEGIIASSKAAHASFNALGVEQVYTSTADYMKDIGQGRVLASNSRMAQRSTVDNYTERALRSITETKAVLTRYRTYVAEQTIKRAA